VNQSFLTTMVLIASALSQKPWSKPKWLRRREEMELSTTSFMSVNGSTLTAILSFWENGAVLSFNWLDWGVAHRVEIVFEDGDGAQIVRVTVPNRLGFRGHEKKSDEFYQYLADQITTVVVESGMLEEIKAARTFA